MHRTSRLRSRCTANVIGAGSLIRRVDFSPPVPIYSLAGPGRGGKRQFSRGGKAFVEPAARRSVSRKAIAAPRPGTPARPVSRQPVMDWKSFLRSFSLCAACLKVKVGYSVAAAPRRGCSPINPTTPPRRKPAAPSQAISLPCRHGPLGMSAGTCCLAMSGADTAPSWPDGGDSGTAVGRVASPKKWSNGLYRGTGAGVKVALMKRNFSSATGGCSDNTPKWVDIQTWIITC